MWKAIFLFPDYEKLKNEIERMRTELSMLVLERDELRFVECANLQMKYLLAFGALEYRAFELECTYKRLKRKIEMIQASLNRQESPDLIRIEKMLEVEFQEFKDALEQQMKQVNDAIDRSQGDFLILADAAELKRLYRQIVKELHPELHPESTDVQLKLFQNAVDAYEHGDLETMRIIATIVLNHSLPDDTEDALSYMLKEKERLTSMLESIRESISAIKADFPYTMKSILSDDEKMTQHTGSCRTGIIESSYYNSILRYTGGNSQ